MEFRVPGELTALRESFAAFLHREVRPVEEAVAGQYRSPSPDRENLREAAAEVRRRSARHGFFAAHLPEQVGGAGVSTLGTALLVEDAAASGLRLGPAAVGPPSPDGPSPLLLRLPEHLWDEYVRPVVRGERTMCFALTEPEAGSDAQAIRTRASRDRDGWVLDGVKQFITGGDVADFAVVFAVTDPEKRAGGGITAFVVPRAQYRVNRVQWTLADSHPCELVFDAARVPEDHVVGEVGEGFPEAMQFLSAGRAYIAAHCLGLAELCLDRAVAHAGARTAFGQPIGRNQAVAFPLAESKVEIEAMRWLVYRLAWAVDEGSAQPADASIAKYYATERAFRIADRCVQVFGGTGVLLEGPVEHVLRHLRVMRVVEGTSEIQQLVVARSLGL